MQVTWVFPGLFVLLWSTGFIGAKLGLPYAEPFTFLSLRFIGVLAILLPICWISRAPWPTRQGLAHMAVAGALMQAGYLGGVFASLHHGMPAGVSALIPACNPSVPRSSAAGCCGSGCPRASGPAWRSGWPASRS